MPSRRASVVVFATLTLSVGCAASPRCPAHGGAPWHEVTSQHFVLRTDLAPSEARAATADFERQYTMLEDVAFPGYEEATERIAIVLFRDAGDYRVFQPWGTGGVFYDRLPQDLERAPTMVLHDRLDDQTRIVITHELTHRFLRRAFGYLPTWLNEGLAD